MGDRPEAGGAVAAHGRRAAATPDPAPAIVGARVSAPFQFGDKALLEHVGEVTLERELARVQGGVEVAQQADVFPPGAAVEDVVGGGLELPPGEPAVGFGPEQVTA